MSGAADPSDPDRERDGDDDAGVRFDFRDLGMPRWFGRALTAACIATVPAAIIQFEADKSAVRDVAVAVNWATWAVFAVAMAVVARRAPNTRNWLRSNPLDVAVLVFSIPFFPLPMQLLRGVWLIRFVRTHGLSRLVFSGQAIRYTLVALVLAVVGGGSLFAALEHTDVGTGVYWATTTVTIVGYGDVVPTTTATRILAMTVMSVGIMSLGFLTAAASERWMESMRAAHAVGPGSPTDQAAVLAELREISTRLTAIEARLDPPGPARP